jgi:hypothetical protein
MALGAEIANLAKARRQQTEISPGEVALRFGDLVREWWHFWGEQTSAQTAELWFQPGAGILKRQ